MELLHVSAEYSNVVLVAILPYVSEFAGKLKLPFPLPITVDHVARFAPDPRQGFVGGTVVLTNEYSFMFEHGHVLNFVAPGSLVRLHDMDRLRQYYGAVNMDETAVVALVREYVSKLEGNSISNLIAQKPSVVLPARIQGYDVPRYEVRWSYAGDTGPPCIKVEVDASRKTIVRMFLAATNFWRDNPHITVPVRPATTSRPSRLTPVSAAYSNALLLAVLPQMSDFSRKLNLPVVTPFDISMVTNVEIGLWQDSPVVRAALTNGFEFDFGHGYVMGFGEPDCFFASNSKNYQDYIAPLVMTEDEMIAIGREAVSRLGYSDKGLPLVGKPHLRGGPNMKTTPDMCRFWFQWDYSTVDNPYPPPVIGFEVDASRRILKSIVINHTNLWRAPPDVRDQPPPE